MRDHALGAALHKLMAGTEVHEVGVVFTLTTGTEVLGKCSARDIAFDAIHLRDLATGEGPGVIIDCGAIIMVRRAESTVYPLPSNIARGHR